MNTEVYIFSLLKTTVVIIIILLSFIYWIPIICICRFHQPNSLFTLDLSVATILCCLSWLPQYAANMFDNSDDFTNQAMIFLLIVQILFTIQVRLSFMVVSVHRYCSLVYHTKIFLRRKRWIILSIGSQWLLGFVFINTNYNVY